MSPDIRIDLRSTEMLQRQLPVLRAAIRERNPETGKRSHLHAPLFRLNAIEYVRAIRDELRNRQRASAQMWEGATLPKRHVEADSPEPRSTAQASALGVEPATNANSPNPASESGSTNIPPTTTSGTQK